MWIKDKGDDFIKIGESMLRNSEEIWLEFSVLRDMLTSRNGLDYGDFIGV